LMHQRAAFVFWPFDFDRRSAAGKAAAALRLA
jgi:hypothetical protein